MDKLRIIRTKAMRMGLLNGPGAAIQISNRPAKKFMYRADYTSPWVYFGAAGMEDYLDHGDPDRRRSFRRRMYGILLKNGERAVSVVGSPAYLSYFLLW